MSLLIFLALFLSIGYIIQREDERAQKIADESEDIPFPEAEAIRRLEEREKDRNDDDPLV